MSTTIKVVWCSDTLFWYNHYLGQTFTVLRYEQNVYKGNNVYWVREPSGYTNFILEKDCELCEK